MSIINLAALSNVGYSFVNNANTINITLGVADKITNYTISGTANYTQINFYIIRPNTAITTINMDFKAAIFNCPVYFSTCAQNEASVMPKLNGSKRVVTMTGNATFNQRVIFNNHESSTYNFDKFTINTSDAKITSNALLSLYGMGYYNISSSILNINLLSQTHAINQWCPNIKVVDSAINGIITAPIDNFIPKMYFNTIMPYKVQLNTQMNVELDENVIIGFNMVMRDTNFKSIKCAINAGFTLTLINCTFDLGFDIAAKGNIVYQQCKFNINDNIQEIANTTDCDIILHEVFTPNGNNALCRYCLPTGTFDFSKYKDLQLMGSENSIVECDVNTLKLHSDITLKNSSIKNIEFINTNTLTCNNVKIFGNLRANKYVDILGEYEFISENIDTSKYSSVELDIIKNMKFILDHDGEFNVINTIPISILVKQTLMIKNINIHLTSSAPIKFETNSNIITLSGNAYKVDVTDCLNISCNGLIFNTSLTPYIGSLKNIDGITININNGEYDCDDVCWYGPTIHLMGDTYKFKNVNKSGLKLYSNSPSTLEIESNCGINLITNINNTFTIKNSTMSNENSQDIPIINISGCGGVILNNNTFKLYSNAIVNLPQYTQTANNVIYCGTIDFNVGDHFETVISTESEISILNCMRKLVINGDKMKLKNSSCKDLVINVSKAIIDACTMENLQITCSDKIQIINTTLINTTNINGNGLIELKDNKLKNTTNAWFVLNDEISIKMKSCTFDNSKPKYGIISNTVGKSIINTSNVEIPYENLAVYWPTLSKTIHNNPLISLYAAQDYDNVLEIEHNYDGYFINKTRIDELKFSIVSGNPNVSNKTIKSILTTSLNNNSMFFGKLVNPSNDISTGNTKIIFTIEFPLSNAYIGNATVTIMHEQYENVKPIIYNIIEHAALPEIIINTKEINISSLVSSNININFEFTNSFAIPLFVIPNIILSSNVSIFNLFSSTVDNIQLIKAGDKHVSFNIQYSGSDLHGFFDFKITNMRNSIKSENTIYEIRDKIKINNIMTFKNIVCSLDGEYANLDNILYTNNEVAKYNANNGFKNSVMTYTLDAFISTYTSKEIIVNAQNPDFTYNYKSADIEIVSLNGETIFKFAELNKFYKFSVIVSTVHEPDKYIFGTSLNKLIFAFSEPRIGIEDVNNITEITSYFSIPEIIDININNSSLVNNTFKYTKGTPFTMSLNVFGIVNNDVAITFKSTFIPPYLRSNIDKLLKLIIPKGKNSIDISLCIEQDNIIHNNAEITLYPYQLFTNDNVFYIDKNLSINIPEFIKLVDSSRTHMLTFGAGCGDEINKQTSSIIGQDVNGNSTLAIPTQFSQSNITSLQPTTTNLLMNLTIKSNSIPYNMSNGISTEIQVNLVIRACNTTIGSYFWSNLVIGTDIFVYNNPYQDGVNNISNIILNSSTYNQNNVLYILQGPTVYNYIQICYYASNLENIDLDKTNDYFGLPHSWAPEVICTFDYTNATSSISSFRICNLGDWSISSDGIGNLKLQYTGSVVGDAAGGSYILPAPKSSENSIILSELLPTHKINS